MKSLTGLQAISAKLKPLVDRQLAQVLGRQTKQAQRLGPETLALVSTLESLCMRGGKRLRPLLLHVGALCHDSSFPLARSVEAGVALELLQAYFLIHDDWMDEDSERRGGPTAHVALGKTLGSAHLGERAAILAGDFAIALAQECLANVAVPAGNLVSASQAFAQMQKSAVLGQQLDVVAQTADAELTYELKTASYTVQGPLEVGVCLAGGDKKLCTALKRYARPAGVAFQLRDDMLGLFGEPEVTGKPRGADLLAGKKTAFLQLAAKELPPRQRKLLKSLYGARQAEPRSVEEALRMLADCKTRGKVEGRIQELKTQALRSLSSPALSPSGRTLLTEATEVLISRNF